jgi:hypothetical protein
MSIALNNYTNYDTGGKIVSWQRNNDGSATDVILSGTYATTTPVSVEAQLNGGAFTTLSAQTIGGGTWVGTLPAVTAGSPTLVVRMSNDHAQTDTAELMLGDFYLLMGDSIAVGQNITGQVSTTASPFNRYSHNGFEWVRADLTAGDGFWPILAGLLAADQGVPVGYMNVASSGTHTGQWESGTLPDAGTTAINSAFLNRVRFVLWQLGTNDVISGGNQTRSAVAASLAAATAYVNSHIPLGTDTIHLHGMFGNCPSSTGTLRTVEDQVRAGILDACVAGTTHIGGNLIDIPESDGTHPDNASAHTLAQRWWCAISNAVYGHADRGYPRVSNVYQATSNHIVVAFEQLLWANVMDTACWIVTDNGTPIAVDFVDNGPGDYEVTLTLHSAATGAVVVSMASGNDATNKVLPIRYAITTPDGGSIYLSPMPEANRATQTIGAQKI